MGYVLFILVNATLFIRPSEVIPALVDVPVYYIVIVPCIALSLPTLVAQFSGRSLSAQPITVGVLGMLVLMILSHLSHLNVYDAWRVVEVFPKVVLFYLLLISLVNSVARLRYYLITLVLLTSVLTGMALLHYHGIVDIPACEPVNDGEENPTTGEFYVIRRLCSSGIFHDPNDLCLILVTSMAICLYLITDRRMGLLRPIWIAPLVVFSYALTLTYSRGGFIALLASLLVLLYSRFGWKRSIPLALIAVPAMFALFGGRQTDLSTSGDTGQERIQVWTEGLALFRKAPIFGIGEGRFVDEVNKVAHNSFVHAYTELGFFGGTTFLSIYFLSLWIPYRLDPLRHPDIDPELRRFRPYLMAIAAGYAAGMLTLTRCYIVPTYLYPGLVTVYAHLACPDPSFPALRLEPRLLRNLAVLGAAFVFVIHIYVRLFANWG